MANPYPAIVLDQNGETRVAGQVNFTDSGNQPGGVLPDPITAPVTIAPTAGSNSLTVKNNEGNTLLLVGDQAGACLVQLVGAFGDGFNIAEIGGTAAFHVEANGPEATDLKIAFFDVPAVAQPVVSSGTVTPEQLALALQSTGLLGGT